jgi:hypothetical protein
MDRAVRITIDSHAAQRASERGTDEKEIREAIHFGEMFPAKRGRSEFRLIFAYEALWEGTYYRNKQLHVFAAEQPGGWHAITVIVKFF